MRPGWGGGLAGVGGLWLTCAYAYLIGVFLRHGLYNIGVLGVAEVVTSAVQVMLVIPLAVIIGLFAWLAGGAVTQPWRRRLGEPPAQGLLIALLVSLLLVDLGAFSGALAANPVLAVAATPVAIIVLFVWATGFDEAKGGAIARVAAMALVAVLLSYKVGYAAKPRPMIVTQSDGAVICGAMVLSSDNAVFILVPPRERGLTVVRDYRLLTPGKCP